MKTIYTITMIRPDRKRKVARRLIEDNVRVASVPQKFGYLNHKLFTDAERGPDGTVYLLEEENDNGRSVATITKRGGRYIG